MDTRRYSRLGKRVIETSFPGLEEMLYHIEKAPVNTEAFPNECYSETGSLSFTGTESLEKAISLCRQGYYEDFGSFMDLQQQLRSHLPTVAFQRGLTTDVYGFAPNVPAYLHGSPKAMYRIVPQPENKFVNLYFNCSYPSTTSYSQIRHRGVCTMALVELLESTGYRVALHFFSLVAAKSRPLFLYMTTMLKAPGDMMDPVSCYFPICHPSYLRRILFRLIEVTPGIDSSWEYNYGRAPTLEDTKAFLNIDAEMSILVNAPDDMDIAGESLLEDARNFLEKIHISQYVSLRTNPNLILPERPGLELFF